MKRLMVLVLLASVAVLILVFITNPELLDKFWLWLIGFAGYIIALLDKGYQSLISFYRKKMGSTAPPYAPPIDIDAKLEAFEGRLANIENKLIKEELSQETVYRSE